MSKSSTRRIPMVLIVVLAVLLASVMSFSIVDGISKAGEEQNIVKENELTFGQFSDIHYFPLDYCYQDVKAEGYKTSDFYNSMTGDTKLVLESGMILKQQVEQYIADAKNGDCPKYVFASGDLSKNGEVTALVDVANAFALYAKRDKKNRGLQELPSLCDSGQPRPLQHVGRALLASRRFGQTLRCRERNAICTYLRRSRLSRRKPYG